MFFSFHLDQPPAQTRASFKIKIMLPSEATEQEQSELKVQEHCEPDRPPQVGRCHLKDYAWGMLKSSKQKWCRLHMDPAIQICDSPPSTKTAQVILWNSRKEKNRASEELAISSQNMTALGYENQEKLYGSSEVELQNYSMQLLRTYLILSYIFKITSAIWLQHSWLEAKPEPQLSNSSSL